MFWVEGCNCLKPSWSDKYQINYSLIDSNNNEEMADAVNTGQLIYCSELIVAHQKAITELTSLIILGKVENN